MRIAVIDIETTGLDPQRHEIIEIAVILTENNYETERMSWKIIPSHIETADSKALKVNGYAAEAWESAKPLSTVMSELSKMCEGYHFAAYNATFDWSFIGKAFSDTGVKDTFHYHRIDIMSMVWAHRGFQDNTPSLNQACHDYGIPLEEGIHYAMNGALKAYQVLCR
jgi:DNA polymerase III subunit epsilon